MTALRFLTAGESHGPTLMGIIEGIPAGLVLSVADINHDLARRQQGYGRGDRMAIETDTVRILSGVRHGRTLGSPICLAVKNRDGENWRQIMATEEPSPGARGAPLTRPRPGHGDLAGMLKYGTRDARDILERASARETAMRVAVGAIARKLLGHFGITLCSHVVQIKDVVVGDLDLCTAELLRRAEASPLHCADKEASDAMIATIDAARHDGDSLGGAFEVIAEHVPAGLGSHVHWDRRLDGRLAQALMSIPAIKAVEIGLGRESGSRPGSAVHDGIRFRSRETDPTPDAADEFQARPPTAGGFYRPTNRAGGIEAGISNGAPICLRATMKPIPTLYRPLVSVDVVSLESVDAGIERSDICAVPAAAIVGEAVVAWVLAVAFLEKFGGDAMQEIEPRVEEYLRSLCPKHWPPGESEE